MADKRELILARAFTVLGGLTGVVTKNRNKRLLDNDKRPAVVLLDGDETNRLANTPNGRPRMAPQIMTMRPQMFIVLKSQQPQAQDSNAVNIGSQLNEFRAKLIEALAQDTQLWTLLGSNGGMSLDACETDLKSGEMLQGQMRLDFAIWYVMDPYVLTAS